MLNDNPANVDTYHMSTQNSNVSLAFDLRFHNLKNFRSKGDSTDPNDSDSDNSVILYS